MNKKDILYKEYGELKDKYLTNNSLETKEELKNKIIELDYEISKEYEEKLKNDFSMTTTLEKEEKRLEELTKFIKETQIEQKNLIEEYKKLTGLNLELSYLKDSDKLSRYKQRLDLVKKVLVVINDLTKLLNIKKDSNNTRVKVLKTRLMKKEVLNLLYEFCLIDNLDIKEIDLNKLIKIEEKTFQKEEKQLDIEKTKEVSVKEKKQDKIITQQENKPKEEITKEKAIVLAPIEQQEEDNILKTMPILERLGTVTPVNVFESIKKTEEKLPDVTIPTNGLTEENTEVFINTNEYFK